MSDCVQLRLNRADRTDIRYRQMDRSKIENVIACDDDDDDYDDYDALVDVFDQVKVNAVHFLAIL